MLWKHALMWAVGGTGLFAGARFVNKMIVEKQEDELWDIIFPIGRRYGNIITECEICKGIFNKYEKLTELSPDANERMQTMRSEMNLMRIIETNTRQKMDTLDEIRYLCSPLNNFFEGMKLKERLDKINDDSLQDLQTAEASCKTIEELGQKMSVYLKMREIIKYHQTWRKDLDSVNEKKEKMNSMKHIIDADKDMQDAFNEIEVAKTELDAIDTSDPFINHSIESIDEGNKMRREMTLYKAKMDEKISHFNEKCAKLEAMIEKSKKKDDA